MFDDVAVMQMQKPTDAHQSPCAAADAKLSGPGSSAPGPRCCAPALILLIKCDFFCNTDFDDMLFDVGL